VVKFSEINKTTETICKVFDLNSVQSEKTDKYYYLYWLHFVCFTILDKII